MGFLWNLIVDHIPLWGWIVIFGAPIIALLVYFGPILLPIWRMLPAPVRGIIMAIGAALLAYLGGRYTGRKNAEDADKARNADALNKRTQVDHEIDSISNTEAQKRLRDRWSKPSDK